MMSALGFKLGIAKRELQQWVIRYTISDEERTIEDEIVPLVRARGFYEKEEFLTLCRWRSPRAVARCRPNDADFVRAVTRIALGEAHERIRIGVLRLLRGVDWPTASVLLHFGHRDRYPIIDVGGAVVSGRVSGLATYVRVVVGLRRVLRHAERRVRPLHA